MYTAFLRGGYMVILPRPPPKSSKKSNKTYLIINGFLMREHQEPAISTPVKAMKLHPERQFIIAYQRVPVNKEPVMNTLKMEKKKQVLNALIEGNSIRSTERMTGVHRDTIMRLLIKTGNTCQKLSDEKVRNFHCKRIQVDEIWTYVLKKEKSQTKEEKRSELFGSQYCFVAIDADSKLVSNFLIGKRDRKTSIKFISDLKDKIKNNGRIQLTSDGWKAYPDAVDLAFGGDIDFSQLVKVYTGKKSDQGRYALPTLRRVLSTIINEIPNPKHISTSFVERQNFTMRMQIRRFTRLSSGFSKKLDNLKSAVALHFYHYNFMRIHRSLRYTPAMASGITNHIWAWEDIL